MGKDVIVTNYIYNDILLKEYHNSLPRKEKKKAKKEFKKSIVVNFIRRNKK